MTKTAPTLELPAGCAPGLEPEEFFRFTHRLSQHPLLQMEALADLADRLPPDRIEVTEAEAPQVVGRRETQRLGDVSLELSAGELVRRAETDRRWLAMRNVEDDLAYRQLVEQLFAEFVATARLPPDAVYRPEGYVFIGATGAVTPAHVDHEHNLFCQVRGTKRFTTGGFPDQARRHRTFEGMYSDEYGSTDFPPSSPMVHVLGPGDGLYVPPSAVHVVENTDSLAISFSLVFHDATLDRIAAVYAFNAHLRQLRIDPRPPGESPGRDRLKSAAVEGWRRAKAFRRHA